MDYDFCMLLRDKEARQLSTCLNRWLHSAAVTDWTIEPWYPGTKNLRSLKNMVCCRASLKFLKQTNQSITETTATLNWVIVYNEYSTSNSTKCLPKFTSHTWTTVFEQASVVQKDNAIYWNTATKGLRMSQVEHFRSLFQSHFPVRSKSPPRARLHSVCSLWFSCSASCCLCFWLFCSYWNCFYG